MPVTNVSWNDCQDFIKKLNAKTNGGYRLPTEAEWEYACRAGSKTVYSFGDSIIKGDANYGPGGKSVAVGSYKPNAFGLFDMHGNVWEWCEDWLGGYPEEAVTDPMGAVMGNFRVLRGGSFYAVALKVRSADRNAIYGLPVFRDLYLGLRLVGTP